MRLREEAQAAWQEVCKAEMLLVRAKWDAKLARESLRSAEAHRKSSVAWGTARRVAAQWVGEVLAAKEATTKTVGLEWVPLDLAEAEEHSEDDGLDAHG